MLDDEDFVPALASAHADTGGVFNPHLYAIGSGTRPEFFMDQRLREQILDSAARKDITPLASTLTVHHELIHLAQFLSTNFGLRCLLTLESTLAALRQGPDNQKLPLLPDDRHGAQDRPGLTSSIQDLVSLYTRELRFFAGEGAGLPRWRASQQAVSLDLLSGDPATASAEFQLLFPSTPSGIAPDAAGRSIAFQGIGRGSYRFVDMNAGKLFEAFAVLGEFNLLLWLNEELEEPAWADRYLDSMPLDYACVVRTYLDHYGHDNQLLTPQLAALVDIALMYDPVLLEPDQAAAGQRGLAPASPIDLFWRACAAARDVSPVTSDDPGDAQRFQDQVCTALQIPPVEQLTERGLAVLQERWEQSSLTSPPDRPQTRDYRPDPRDLSVPFALHRNMLSLRRELPEAYFWRILDPEFTQQFCEAHHRSINFYDIASKQRWDYKPWLWMMASIGNVILDAASRRRVECPLKQGRPYYCDARNDPFGVYCTRELADGTEFICPFAEFHSKTEVGLDLANRQAWDKV